MSSEIIASPTTPIVLHFGPALPRMTNDQFYEFCQSNRELRIERTAKGDLIIMPPAGGNTSWRNCDLSSQLAVWSKRDGKGIAFDSSAGFRLPKGGERSPDASWVLLTRWNALSEEEREKFPPLAPDFVIELRSKTDRLPDLRDKLQEYIDNGVRLGWLIDPYSRRFEVYRPGQQPVTLDGPATVSGDPELPGFVLDLNGIW